MYVTRLWLINQVWLQWPPQSFSWILSFSLLAPLIKDVTHISLHKTRNESAAIDIYDSLQMLCHHWVVTWTTNWFKAAHYLKYSFIEEISRNLVPSLVPLYNVSGATYCGTQILQGWKYEYVILLFFLLLFADEIIIYVNFRCLWQWEFQAVVKKHLILTVISFSFYLSVSSLITDTLLIKTLKKWKFWLWDRKAFTHWSDILYAKDVIKG